MYKNDMKILGVCKQEVLKFYKIPKSELFKVVRDATS